MHFFKRPRKPNVAFPAVAVTLVELSVVLNQPSVLPQSSCMDVYWRAPSSIIRGEKITKRVYFFSC